MFLPSSLRTKSTAGRPFWSVPTVADETWSPLNSGGNCFGSSSWPSVAWVEPSGTKSSRPVEPTRRRTASGSVTPGISTTTRSLPWVVTTGSDTPVVFTRRSTMSLMIARSAGVGSLPSTGSAWYSTRRPPFRSRPSFVSTVRHEPSALVESGSWRPGKNTMMSARTPMSRMRMGPALRIEAGCYTEHRAAAPEAVGSVGRNALAHARRAIEISGMHGRGSLGRRGPRAGRSAEGTLQR